MRRLPVISSVAVLALFAAPAAADLVVLDGDSLVDAVAQATDGETIFIQSEGTFVGTLAWSGKTIRIQQGFGFGPPTIVGDPGEPAIDLDTSVQGTGAILEGVILEGGAGQFTARSLFCTGTVGSATIEASDCTFRTPAVVSADATGQIEFNLTDSRVESVLAAYGGGTAQHSLTVKNCELLSVVLQPTASVEIDAAFFDSRISGSVRALDAGNDPRVGLIARRCRFEGRVEFLGDEDGDWSLLLESCLHVGNGLDTAITSSGNVITRGVNLTVTGFQTGIYGEPGATWSNLLLFGNGQDLSPVVLPFQIDHSLISDGTYTGQNGNLAGEPLVDEDYALLAYSPGVDAGDKGAADLGDFDLNGQKRVQDGDGDDVAQVSVGAIETHPPVPAATTEPLPSSGTNPDLLGASLPVVGDATFECKVTSDTTTLLTVVAIGTPAAPFALAGITGEFLLAADQPLLLDYSLASHPLPIPDQPSLYGAQVGAQGVRMDQSLGVVTLTATNGLLLTLGG